MSGTHFSHEPQWDQEETAARQEVSSDLSWQYSAVEPQWQDLPSRRPWSNLAIAGAFVVLVGVVAALLVSALKPPTSVEKVPDGEIPTASQSQGKDVDAQTSPEDSPAAPVQDQDDPTVVADTPSQGITNTTPTIEALPLVEASPVEASLSGDAELDADLAALRPYIAGEGDEALRNAYEYVAANYDYIHQEEYPQGGFETWGIPFAKEMYTNGAGNCYRFSSLFCWIARSLGYDATVVQGMVPLSSGLAVHGWCEVHRDGITYVCDPDLHKFLPEINLFMVTYDDSRLAYYHMDGVTVHTNAEG